ncbi:hypothetical protein BYT27DRAFT_6672650 [Phlegmacium glaucopus]|nr:hypothetical protein BYT27DRAFT_6672650 [Phlegmacium glaucopus]
MHPLLMSDTSYLKWKLTPKLIPKATQYLADGNNMDSLRNHHRSILEHIQYRLGAADVSKACTIENSWTMKAEDTISALQRLREEGNGDDWKAAVEKGKEKERNEESLVICDYFMHSSIERERQLLDERRVKWIARRMEMVAKERLEGEMGVEYRVNKKAVQTKPATKLSKNMVERLLFCEHYWMELVLVYEVKEWEQLFWNKLKDVLDQIGNDRVEEKEKLTREWGTNCWKRLNPQMRAAEKRLADLDKGNAWFASHSRQKVHNQWASHIQQFFEGVEKPNSTSLSELREEIEHFSLITDDDEIQLQMEKGIEDTEFRLKRGSELGRFDQFWDDDTLFECRYSRSKWFNLGISRTAPLEIYSHALKGNKNIIFITFDGFDSDSDVNWIQATINDLPWVTSISRDRSGCLPASHRDPLFNKSTNNDLITFAKEIRPKLDSFTYIFTDADASDMHSNPVGLGNNAGVLISFVAPISGKSLILRLKHSGEDDEPLKVTLGSTIIQLNPSSKSSLKIDDITLHPIPDPSEPDHLSFEPGIRNDIVIQFSRMYHGHFLHDIGLLDEAGKHYGMPLYSEMDPESRGSKK